MPYMENSTSMDSDSPLYISDSESNEEENHSNSGDETDDNGDRSFFAEFYCSRTNWFCLLEGDLSETKSESNDRVSIQHLEKPMTRSGDEIVRIDQKLPRLADRIGRNDNRQQNLSLLQENSRKMVKEMRFDSNPWPLQKHNHVFVKFGVSILLMGLAFRLYFSRSSGFSPVSDVSVPQTGFSPESHVPVSQTGFSYRPSKEESDDEVKVPGEVFNDQDYQEEGKCDLFTGEWIPDPSGPMYTNESCPVVEEHQNCMKNGRPDTGYLYWTWKPKGCDLPHFDGKKFLEGMRNKSWGFVGDSISRNHVQSLLCLLSKVEEAVEIYHDKEYKSKTWRFPSYNFTLAVIWSPFLVEAAIFEDINGVSTSEVQLYLDILDKKWITQFLSFDYMIISGGKWFLKTSIFWENNTVIGCHYCPGKNLTELGFEYSYRKALQLVLNFITKSGHKGLIFFRTSTPDHFENGEWHNGGTCKRVVPFKQGEISMNIVDSILRNIELDEFKKARAEGLQRGLNLKLLDTNQLSLLRPDGHPGPYRQFHPFAQDKNAKVQNDCLHWCLPGPIDSWSNLVMKMVLN